MSSASIQSLNDLSRLREAPTLDQGTKDQLREELRLALTQFSWFTIGVVAPAAGRDFGDVLRECFCKAGQGSGNYPKAAGVPMRKEACHNVTECAFRDDRVSLGEHGAIPLFRHRREDAHAAWVRFEYALRLCTRRDAGCRALRAKQRAPACASDLNTTSLLDGARACDETW